MHAAGLADLLRLSFYALNAWHGIRGGRCDVKDYEVTLESTFKGCTILTSGAYRALPSRRSTYPKPDGRPTRRDLVAFSYQMRAKRS